MQVFFLVSACFLCGCSLVVDGVRIEVVEREGKMKALIEEIGEGAKKVGGASIQEAEVREMEA